MAKTDFDPDWIPPPGATVEDLLSRKTTSPPRSLLVARLGKEQAEKLLDGQLSIDANLADFLSQVVGLPVSFWLEREKLYRDALLQRQSDKRFLLDISADEMKQKNWIKPVPSHTETAAEVSEFFGKEDLEACKELVQQLPSLIKQKSSRTIVSRPGPLAVWVRAGEIEADRTQCADWDRERLRRTLPELRKLTRTEDPKKYLPVLKSFCQACGVAFVVLHAPSGCVARGATKFISPTKAMLLVSYRHLTDDQFWFSVFHELGHLLLHGEEETFIDDDWENNIAREELEADQFAADTLIPPTEQHELNNLTDAVAIIGFARRIGVSRGIIVGQMQHKEILPFSYFNKLKVYYQWDAENQIEKKPRS